MLNEIIKQQKNNNQIILYNYIYYNITYIINKMWRNCEYDRSLIIHTQKQKSFIGSQFFFTS